MGRLISGLLVLILIPLPGFGRDNGYSWENLKQLKPGQNIQVVDMKLKSYNATFVSVTEEAISLRTNQGDLNIDRANVLRVSTRESSKRLRNALIGAAIGGGVMAIPAGLVGTICSNEGGRCAGAITGAIGLGAGVGFGAGFAVPSYPTIYRAKKRP